MSSEIRKGGGYSLWSESPCGDSEAQAEESEPDEPQPGVDLDAPISGIRRDRTQFFNGSRRAGFPRPPRRPRPPSSSAARGGGGGDAAELQAIHAEASQGHTSLASKLAQHNGFLQIGLSTPERVMPVEMRISATTIEDDIEAALVDLERLLARLARLEAGQPGSFSEGAVRRALREYIETGALGPMRATFQKQRVRLGELHLASPLTSPKMSPLLHKRLFASVSSPPGSPAMAITRAPSSASSSSCATPHMRGARHPGLCPAPFGNLELDEVSGDEDEEDDLDDAPFNSVLGLGLAGSAFDLIVVEDAQGTAQPLAERSWPSSWD